MSKEVSFKNRDRFVQLGIAIAALRKMRGLSQEKLAEKAGVSRSLISTIEAPNMAHGFSLDVFFDIADALEVDPADLINASMFPDRIIKWKELLMRLKLRRIFRRFMRQALYLTYLLFYCIVGIITIWFSQNTTYNFFIRQEMW